MNIPFNKPHLTGKEVHYMYEAVYKYSHISGNGVFTKKCQSFFEEKYGFKKTLLTTSCTDALEMSALLMDIKPGDEVIVPSYTFVSTALAYVRQGAKIIFADSRINHPGIDEDKIEELITPKTKAIVVVHYAGVACDMDKVMAIADKHNLFVVEDAAQAIDSYYLPREIQDENSIIGNNSNISRDKGKPLGGIGHFGVFSFHETKNIQCGEGGMLVVNDERFIKRSEIIWEKGTNRSDFFKGEVNKYGWVDVGSSFLPADIIAAFLYAQLENLDDIQKKRKEIWNTYNNGLKSLEVDGFIKLPKIEKYATNNAHMFYIICRNNNERTNLIAYLKTNNIHAVFHYLSLHKSEFYKKKHDGRILRQSDNYNNRLLRLPFYYDMSAFEQSEVIKAIINFFL